MGRGKKIVDKGIVLEAALGIIENEGLEQFSTRRLAAALGISAMTLYNYYDNRGAILREVALRGLGDFFERYEAEAKAMDSEGGGPLRVFKALAMEFLRFGRERPLLYLFLFDSSLAEIRHDPQVARYFTHTFNTVVGRLRDQSALPDLRADITLFQVLANGLVINFIRGRTSLDEERFKAYIERAYGLLLEPHEGELLP